MPSDSSARRVLSFTMGIAALFDLTGATIYRTMRPTMPQAPPASPEADPLRSAMATIMAAHREAVGPACDERRVTLAA
ncbi:MAG: hypothetical protein ACLPUO_17650 [Streptosporangiaceae bacterium]|jgi:hypothetical protein